MTRQGFSGSYDPSDVTFLLKPVTLQPTDIATKETLIQSGARHYSEMLSPEFPPTTEYLALYDTALVRNGARLAGDIASLAATLDLRHPEGREIVLTSLVRAGTPVAILIARALRRLGREVAHYAVSIIRDRGIDQVALDHIMQSHNSTDIVFVDGWTGKGAIATELRSSLAGKMNPFLVVVADPAGQADLAATHDDYLIASGLLNSVVSGLISRSILSTDIVGPLDFHACVMFNALAPFDRSCDFINYIDAFTKYSSPILDDQNAISAARAACENMVSFIMEDSQTNNRNLVKLGIAESTRAILRRVPERLYIRDMNDPDVQHLVHLANAKGLHIKALNHAGHFRAAAVIQSIET
jgi:Phosphoribosyl transferase (PRTase)/PELOTA RNA binding domain